MKAFTDLEQSKRLAEFLSLESADLHYSFDLDFEEIENTPTVTEEDDHFTLFPKDIPCWSLAALMDVLDRGATFKTPQGWACQAYIGHKAIISNFHNNPVDACYEMILHLHELKML